MSFSEWVSTGGSLRLELSCLRFSCNRIQFKKRLTSFIYVGATLRYMMRVSATFDSEV